MKASSLIGKQFGRLTVIGTDYSRYGYVVCKCKCGTIKSVAITALTQNRTRSCGCLRRESAQKRCMNGHSENFQDQYNAMRTLHTILPKTGVKKLDKRNKTGHTGVWYSEKQDRYYAYMTLQGNNRYLGSYKDLDSAVHAREEAESKYLQPVINQWREAFHMEAL